MKRNIVIMTLIVAFVFLIAQSSESEAWHRSGFSVAVGPGFYGSPFSAGYSTFGRHSSFSIGFSGFWPGYYYPYYPAYRHGPRVYYRPGYYGPVYYDRRYYRRDYYDRDWDKDAEEFLRGGR